MLSEPLTATRRPPPARQAPCVLLHERVRADPPAPGFCACTIKGINPLSECFHRVRRAAQLARLLFYLLAHACFSESGSVTHGLLRHGCEAPERCTC